jgi:hypothetical protein
VPLQEFEMCRNQKLLRKKLKANHLVDSKLELELKFDGVIDNSSNKQ